MQNETEHQWIVERSIRNDDDTLKKTGLANQNHRPIIGEITQNTFNPLNASQTANSLSSSPSHPPYSSAPPNHAKA